MTEDLFSSEHLITRQKRLDNGATCSVWFAFTTTTISGFDDVYPLTTAGRVVAGIMSFIGLALMLGFISNVGTSFVVSKLSKNHEKQVDETKELVKNKMNTLEQLQVNDISCENKQTRGSIDKARELHLHGL